MQPIVIIANGRRPSRRDQLWPVGLTPDSTEKTGSRIERIALVQDRIKTIVTAGRDPFLRTID